MSTLAVAAGVGRWALGSGAAVGGMFFSTMLAVSLTFACLCSVSIMVASVALCHGAVLNKELTVFELPVMEQAFLHHNDSFSRAPNLKEESLMCFAMLQRLQALGDTKNFDSRLVGRVLGLNVGDRLSLFLLVNPAYFDTMGHHHEPVALNTRLASNDSCPCSVLLQKSLG